MGVAATRYVSQPAQTLSKPQAVGIHRQIVAHSAYFCDINQ